MSCGVGRRGGLDLALPWLRCRPAASAPIGLLVWEPPCARDAALKRQKKKTKTVLYISFSNQNPNEVQLPLIFCMACSTIDTFIINLLSC